MSQENQDSAVDSAAAGVGTDGARDALSEIMDRKREKEDLAADRPPSGPRKPLLARWTVLAGLAGILMAVIAWNVQVFSQPAAVPTQWESATAARIMMSVATLQLESFKREHGRLPQTLEEAGAPVDSLVYTPFGDHYRLEARVGGNSLWYEDRDGPGMLLEGMIERKPVPE